jgi:hypothetical protein
MAPIKEIRIDNRSNWARKHTTALQMNYSKAPYFDQYFADLEKIYQHTWTFLVDLDNKLMYYLMEQIGLQREICLSSELRISGGKVDRLIAISQHFGARRFLEGDAGENYIDGKLFEPAGIELVYQHYKHPTYDQLYGAFIPYLSTLDLLFNHGSKSLSILVDTPKDSS